MKKTFKLAAMAAFFGFALALTGCANGSDGGSGSGDSGNGNGGNENKPLSIELSSEVPHLNGYTGTKSNTSVTVIADITSGSEITKVVYKKNGSENPSTLLADPDAKAVSKASDGKYKFTINASGEFENGTYTVAAQDEIGRKEVMQIEINQFDFTGPSLLKSLKGNYSGSSVVFDWTEPDDADYAKLKVYYISNNGSSDSSQSSPVEIAKGTTQKTFSGLESSKKYYKYFFVSVDELGNESSKVIPYKVSTASPAVAPAGFVSIAGTTVLGAIADSKVFINERMVEIQDLFVCDHEVTQKEFQKYCFFAGKYPPSADNGLGDDYPAYALNWYDAIVYCNLRTIDEFGVEDCVYSINGEKDPKKWPNIEKNEAGKYAGYDANYSVWDKTAFDTNARGYRLPTVAEWEYAARGGNNGIPLPQTTYSGSDILDDVAWHVGNDDGKYHTVKTKASNAIGIYDMSGNIFEWCWDWQGEINASTGALGPDWNGSQTYRKYMYGVPLSDIGNGWNMKQRSNGLRVVRNAQ